MRADADGANVTEVLSGAANIKGPNGLEFGQGRLWWTDQQLTAVKSVLPDGSDVKTFTVASNPYDVFIGDRVYWTSQTANYLDSAKVDGTDANRILGNSVIVSPFPVAVTEANIYWGEVNGQGRIRRSDLAGGNVTTLINNVFSYDFQIVGDKIYLADNNFPAGIKRANIDGSELIPLTAEGVVGLAHGIFVTEDAIYWADFGTRAINKAGLDGSSPTALISRPDASVRGVVVLTVADGETAPSITQQPQSQTASVGATVNFSVTATGTEPLTYSWRKNGTEPVGGNQPTLGLDNVQTGSAGDYLVIVSNSSGSVTSVVATLTITSTATAPTITQHPQSQTVDAGASVTFSVAATGTAPLSYQWHKNGAPIDGATGSSYTINPVQAGDAGTYLVRVSNEAGNVPSNEATLTVNTGTTPTAPSITQHPQSQTVNAGGSVTFSVTATGTAPLSYQWHKNGAPIDGATSASYTINPVQTGDAGTYFVRVSNEAGNAPSNEATLTVNETPVTGLEIVALPQNVVVTEGNSALFSVQAVGDEPITYQWSFNGTNIVGETNATLVLSNVQTNNAGSYRVTVSNPSGNLQTQAATLTVNPLTSRTLRILNLHTVGEGQAAATVRINSNGDENFLSFVFGFNQQLVQGIPQVSLVTTTNAAASTNAVLASFVEEGNIRVRIELPEGETLFSGDRELATITFSVPAGADLGQMALVFPEAPVIRDLGGADLLAQVIVEGAAGGQAISTAPDDQTGFFTQSVTVTNPSAGQYPGIRLLVLDLPADTATNKVRVANAHGLLGDIPYFEFGALNPGASIAFTVEYYVQNRLTIPTPRFETMIQAPVAITLPTSVIVNTNATRIVDGKFFAEFLTETGRTYYVQYNNSLTNATGWKTSLPPLRGTGARVQWVDSGPPRTESNPATNQMRFYRVIVLP